ncbi:NmrA-like family protein [Pleurostoma richardsiae]|uniref:NmrA-like family protein n=1 Tax=Pleurostoma richardsiae TaxID=41990 RepID=A0AA38VFW4_9PEZI|nr:NmrA-like family protein [Pleurostoma richardsiae]
MAKKIITVFGATGNQGASVVNKFLNDTKVSHDWAIRGVTRDASSDRAKALAAKGVEVVTADLSDKATLVKAMEGASAVFAMTNYWEKADMELEIQQGKNLADAAKDAGVDHYIWSSLPNVSKLTKGVLPNVYHFDSKAQVEEYVRTLNIPASFFLPGFFMSNFPGGMLHSENDNWILRFPFGADKPIPLFDAVADAGKFIKAMVLHRDQVLGKQILGATDYTTPAQIIEVFKKLFPEAGKTASFEEVTLEEYKKSVPGPEFIQQELLENMRLVGEFGYYGGAGLEESHAILDDELTTWEEHAKNAKAFAGLK